MDSAHDTLSGGLPHSEIHGSTPARGSPWLFAACHVLHRLLVPRHPPNALVILDIADPAPKRQATPCTETILRISLQVSVVSCQKQPRLEAPSTGSGTVPELFYSAHNRIFLSGRRIASLTQRGATSIQQDRSHASEPSPPTVGAPRLHAHDPGQTSQPNDASGPARRGQSATVGTFSPTADDQPPGNRHDDAPRDAPEPDSQ